MARASSEPVDEWDQLCKTILALVESSQGGIPLDVIERDYEDVQGSNIPWQLYEFSSLEEMLSATGTVAVVPREVAEFAGLDKMNEVKGSFDRSLVVVPVKNPKTEHLQRLVSKQRPSAVTRLGGKVHNAAQWLKEDREREMRQKMQQLNIDPSIMKRSSGIVLPTTTIFIDDDGPRSSYASGPSISRQQQQQALRQQQRQPVQRQLVASEPPMPRPAPPISANRTEQRPPTPPSVTVPFRRPESPLIRAAPSTLVQNMVGRGPVPLAERRQEERTRLPPSQSNQMGETSRQVPPQLEMKLGPAFSLDGKAFLPREFIQKITADDQALSGFSIWDRLHTLLFHYARGKEWLLAEHLPLLYQHHFGNSLNLVGFSIVDICSNLQEWVLRWFDTCGMMRVRLRDSACPKDQMIIWHSMIKKVQKDDIKNIRFAIRKLSQEHRENEEDVFEQLTGSIPPVSQALVNGGLHGPKLDSVTRNKIFWLLLAHFPFEGIAMRQLPNAYQNKYDERLKDDQKSLIEQQMADLLRFEKKSPLVTIVRLRFSAVPIADEVREFSGLTSAELQSLIDADIQLGGRSTERSEQPRVTEALQPMQILDAAELGVLVNRTKEFLKQFYGGLWTERVKTMLTRQGHPNVDIEQILLEIKPPVERKYLDNNTCWVRLAEHSRKPWDPEVNRTAAESLDYATSTSVPYSELIVQRLISNGNQSGAVVKDTATIPIRSEVPSVVRTRAAGAPTTLPTSNTTSGSSSATTAVYVPTDKLIDFDVDETVAPSSSATVAVNDIQELLDLTSPPIICNSSLLIDRTSPLLIDRKPSPEPSMPIPFGALPPVNALRQHAPFIAPSLSMTKPIRPAAIPRAPSGRGLSSLLIGVDDLPPENLHCNWQPPKTPVQRLFERHFNFGDGGVQPRTEADIETAIRAQEAFVSLYGLTRDLGVVRLNELAEISNRFNDRGILLGEAELRTVYSEANNRPEFFNLRWKKNEDVVLVAPANADDERVC